MRPQVILAMPANLHEFSAITDKEPEKLLRAPQNPIPVYKDVRLRSEYVRRRLDAERVATLQAFDVQKPMISLYERFIRTEQEDVDEGGKRDRLECGTRGRVPQLHRLVARTRRQQRAVRRECHRRDPVAVALESLERCTLVFLDFGQSFHPLKYLIFELFLHQALVRCENECTTICLQGSLLDRRPTVEGESLYVVNEGGQLKTEAQ